MWTRNVRPTKRRLKLKPNNSSLGSTQKCKQEALSNNALLLVLDLMPGNG